MNSTQPISEQFYGVERTEGSLSRDKLKGLGDSRVCSTPQAEGTNRGLQCLFGDMPPVHAYLIRLDGAAPTSLQTDAASLDERVGTALVCEVPSLPMHMARTSMRGNSLHTSLPGSTESLCVEVTLNGNQTQGTSNCVRFTYYDE